MKRQAVGFALRVTLVAMVMAVMAVSTLASAADAAGEVRVGLLAPMSGPAAKFGQIERSTLTLAMEEVNNAGGIKSLGGAKLRLIIGDSRGEADIGVTETERLITREKVHVIIGAFQSAVAFPASAVAERYQIPWLNDATVDKITERGFKYVFRAEGNDSQKAKTLIDGIVALSRKSTPIKTAVIFSENTEWGNSVGEKQKNFLEAQGIKVLSAQTYPYAAADFTSMIVKAKALNPDVLIANAYLGDAIQITRQMSEQEFRPRVFASGGGGFFQPDYLKAAGKLTEGIIVATHWVPEVGKRVPWIKAVNDRHLARFGVPITEDAAREYQLFFVLVDALERAKTTSPKQLRDAIAATNITDPNNRAMMVPCKQLKFDETGQNPSASAMLVQIQGGGFRLIYPESIAEPGVKLIWPYPQSK